MKFVSELLRLTCLFGLIYIFVIDDNANRLLEKEHIEKSISTVDSASKDLLTLLSQASKVVNF